MGRRRTQLAGVTTFEQVGGMSPGCATRVVTASGRHAFTTYLVTLATYLAYRALTAPDIDLPT